MMSFLMPLRIIGFLEEKIYKARLQAVCIMLRERVSDRVIKMETTAVQVRISN